jgi:hypothetical protein
VAVFGQVQAFGRNAAGFLCFFGINGVAVKGIQARERNGVSEAIVNTKQEILLDVLQIELFFEECL